MTITGGAPPMMPAMMDRRGLNRMSAETRLLHFRLEAWADALLWSSGEFPAEILLTAQAVDALPETERRVLMEFYLHWRPLFALSEKLGMTEPQVRHLVKIARYRIAAYIAARK